MEFQSLGQSGLVFYAANYVIRPPDDEGAEKPKDEDPAEGNKTVSKVFCLFVTLSV